MSSRSTMTEVVTALDPLARELGARPEDILAALAPIQVSGLAGEGGFGVVLRATADGQPMALKIPSPDQSRLRLPFHHAVEAIEHERAFLQAARGIEGVVCLGGTGDVLGVPYMLLEPLGPDLWQGRSAPSVVEALELLAEVAETLARVHQRGLVHNDVSPDNLLRGPEGWVLIDPGPESTERDPYTHSDMLGLGAARDVVALGRSVLSVLVDEAVAEVPEGDFELERDEELRSFFGLLVGEHGFDDVPSAESVARSAVEMATLRE